LNAATRQSTFEFDPTPSVQVVEKHRNKGDKPSRLFRPKDINIERSIEAKHISEIQGISRPCCGPYSRKDTLV
jgi:hypothetical protein